MGVVDFAAYRGLARTGISTESRILIPHLRFGINAALLFARSLGLSDTRRVESAPEAGASRATAPSRWRNLRLAELLVEPRFLDIAD